MKLITRDVRHWQTTDDGFLTPVFLTLGPTPCDLESFRLYGFLIRLALMWDLDLLPINPALIILLRTDYHTVIQRDVIVTVTPTAHEQLCSWVVHHRLTFLSFSLCCVFWPSLHFIDNSNIAYLPHIYEPRPNPQTCSILAATNRFLVP